MFKIIVGNPKLYKKLINLPVLGTFIFFDLSRLNEIKDEQLFLKVLERFRLSNGIYKTTKKNRFHDVDNELIKLLNSNKKYSIHDLAVSDGITSTDLYSSLIKNNIDCDFLISDKYSRILYFKQFGCKIYTQTDGEVIMSDVSGILADRKLPWKFMMSKILGMMFPKKLNFKRKSKEILLLNPTTLKLIESKKMRFKDFDLLGNYDPNEKFDIVRCMNVLNLSYFSEDQIRIALKGLISSLNEGGILVIGRTDMKRSLNNASFLIKEKKGVVELIKINDGSEVMHLVN